MVWKCQAGTRVGSPSVPLAGPPLRLIRDDDRDVAGALVDPVATTLGARPESLERRPLVHPCPADHERAGVELLSMFRVGYGTGQHLADGIARRLRREGEYRPRLLGRHPADEVHHPAGLPRRDAYIPRLRPSFHNRLAFQLSSRAFLPGGPGVAPPGRYSQFVADSPCPGIRDGSWARTVIGFVLSAAGPT